MNFEEHNFVVSFSNFLVDCYFVKRIKTQQHATASPAKFPPEELLKNRCGARLDRGGGAGPNPARPPGATEARPAADFLNTEDGCGI